MINKETHGISEKTKLYLEYLETIKTLQSSFDIDSNQIFEKFIETIKGVFNEEIWIVNCKKDRVYQQVYKTEWNVKPPYIHYEFWMNSQNMLTKPNLEIMIDVEGAKKEEFLRLFDERQKTIKDMYTTSNFLYRPSNRNNAIVFEVIDNEFIPGFSGNKMLVDKLQVLIQLDSVIDDVLSQIR